MTSQMTTDEFFALVGRSGLLGDDRTGPYLARVRAGEPGLASPEGVARQLVRDRLLTPFQARQLLRGRYRGFFLSDKYKVLELLGEGGMGRVLLCEHLMLHKLVAVKLLQAAGGSMAGAAERFLREARAAAQLDHPNIVRVFDVDKAGTVPFMVMDYVDGTNLHQIVAQGGPLAVPRAAEYARQAALGLQAAHEGGLIHRDVKPGNLLLDRTGTVRLLDLGLARFFDTDKNQNLTQKFDEKSVLGTADFIAPEQAMNSSRVDIRADVYSLGCTLYFLLLRKFPFDEGSVTQKLLWHQTREPQPVDEVRSDVPAGLAAVVRRMMAKKPDDRYQTPAEVAAALAPFAGGPAPPPAEEMPKVHPSMYVIGLCGPPSGSTFGAVEMATPNPSQADTSRMTARRSNPDIAFGTAPHTSLPATGTPRSMPRTAAPAAAPPLYPASGFELPPAPAAPAKRSKLLPLLAGVTGLVVTAGLGLGVMALTGNRQTPPTAAAGIVPPATKPTAEPAAVRAGVPLKAGGSTFVAKLMGEWAGEYEKAGLGPVGYNKDPAKTGSTKGVEGMTDRSFDFGCTDAPMSNAEVASAAARGGRVVHVPLVMGAVVPTYNLPDLRGELRFTHELLARIYLGKITRWNDPAIAAANDGTDLPNLPITVVHRGTKKGSGTSYIWTEFLGQDSQAKDDDIGAEFRKQIGVKPLPDWKLGTGADGNDGVAREVYRTPGAIGYVELNYALDNALPVGRVRNREGKFVQPTLRAVTQAAEAALGDLPLDLRYSLVNPPGPDSYPIAGTTWAVVYTVQPDKEKGRSIGEFLWWCTHDEKAKQLAEAKGCATLPPDLVKRLEALIRTIQGAEAVGR